MQHYTHVPRSKTNQINKRRSRIQTMQIDNKFCIFDNEFPLECELTEQVPPSHIVKPNLQRELLDNIVNEREEKHKKQSFEKISRNITQSIITGFQIARFQTTLVNPRASSTASQTNKKIKFTRSHREINRVTQKTVSFQSTAAQ